MNLETRFRGNRLIAYRATAVLISPYFQEFFASVSAVQHFLTIALFIITAPSLIEGICVRDDFLKADDFGVRCIFKSKVGLLTVLLGAFLCGKSPVSGSDAMPVFRCYPPSAFVLMPALCPLPKTIVNLIVDFAECFSGYNKSLVIDPSRITGLSCESGNPALPICCS